MAKTAPSAKPTQTRRKGARATAVKRMRARRAAKPRANPEGGSSLTAGLGDDLKLIGSGVAAYAGTRLLQRLTWTVVAKKKPKYAKHAHAAAGVLAFGAALLAGRKIKALTPYHESVIIGSGVAAVQGVVSAFVPKYAWLMNDCKPEQLGSPAQQEPNHQIASSGDGDYDLLEQQLAAYEQGGSQKKSRRPVQQTLETAAAATGDTQIDDQLMEELGTENIDDLYGGVFEDPTLAN